VAMQHFAASSELYVPETAAMITSGSVPGYNAFPYSGSNEALRQLLERPNSPFVQTVHAAASGAIAGLVSSGDPRDSQALLRDVLSTGRQIEANMQFQRSEAQAAAIEKFEAEHKTTESAKQACEQKAEAFASLFALHAAHDKPPLLSQDGWEDLIHGGFAPKGHSQGHEVEGHAMAVLAHDTYQQEPAQEQSIALQHPAIFSLGAALMSNLRDGVDMPTAAHFRETAPMQGIAAQTYQQAPGMSLAA